MILNICFQFIKRVFIWRYLNPSQGHLWQCYHNSQCLWKDFFLGWTNHNLSSQVFRAICLKKALKLHYFYPATTASIFIFVMFQRRSFVSFKVFSRGLSFWCLFIFIFLNCYLLLHLPVFYILQGNSMCSYCEGSLNLTDDPFPIWYIFMTVFQYILWNENLECKMFCFVFLFRLSFVCQSS